MSTIKIYTKKGDKGLTSILGSIKKVPKCHVRVKCCGSIDELNSWIGLLLVLLKESDYDWTGFKCFKTLIGVLTSIQHQLFSVGTILSDSRCNKNGKYDNLLISEKDVQVLEKSMDKMNEELGPLEGFVLPGGNKLVSYCHIGRSVCRRAERNISELNENFDIENNVLKFINRLSDFLFVVARYLSPSTEIMWSKTVRLSSIDRSNIKE